MIRCAECGCENMDGLEYCDSCGARLQADTAPAAATPAVEEAVTAAPEPPVQPERAQTETPEAAAAQQPAVEETPAPVSEEVPVESPPTAPAAAALQGAKLTIVRGGTVGKEFPLQAGDNLVGRWDPDSGAFPEVDLETDDPEARISRKHALIRVGDTITIEDIGSLNGTFVNRGPRLEPGSPVTLKDGDEIIIGKTFFKMALS